MRNEIVSLQAWKSKQSVITVLQ